MKKYLFFATALVALASCSSNDYIGEQPPVSSQSESGAILFGPDVNATTRADFDHATSAAKLNNNFVVYGVKSDGTINGTAEVKVFDHYNVNYKVNTKNTTTSNTADWEYVAQDKHALSGASAQTIKYWDYAKSQYDFIAFSKGEATAVYAAGSYNKDDNVLITAVTPATMTLSTGGAYTIKGKAANLAKVYIADLKTAYRDGAAPDNYVGTVQFKFRSLSAKVRIALYETVPGYAVKNVIFYSADDTKDGDGDDPAHLYTTGTDVFNEEGTYTVYFPTIGSSKVSETDYNKAHLSFDAETSVGTTTDNAFGTLHNFAETKEGTEADGHYLGRTSNNATYAGNSEKNYYTVVIPNETGAVLNLKVDYTLVSTDGSGETIQVTGATAKVPKEYAAWKSGYAYTYLFKISQNSNGQTGTGTTPEGLYPITFDAVVVNDEADGTQETITTVSEPSITTYAKGTVVTANNEYTTGSNIYVVVNQNGGNVTLNTTPGSVNAKLYTVTLEDGAAQTINEASIANAIANGADGSTTEKHVYVVAAVSSGNDVSDKYKFVNGAYVACGASETADGTTTYYTQNNAPTKTVTDANGKEMVVTESSLMFAVSEIAAADSPDGNAITVNGAKFKPADAGTYVFEYTDTSASKKYYKIIKVVAAP